MTAAPILKPRSIGDSRVASSSRAPALESTFMVSGAAPTAQAWDPSTPPYNPYHRILYYDTHVATELCQHGIITNAIRSHILEQLTQLCGGRGTRDHATFLQAGSAMANKPMSYEEGILCTLEDLRHRESALAADSQGSKDRSKSAITTTDDIARERRMHINQQRICRLKQMLESQPAGTVQRLLAATQNDQRTEPDAVSSFPLESVSPNAVVKHRVPPAGGSKRKRDLSIDQKKSYFIALDSDADGEDGHKNDIHATGAGIKSRTTGEDSPAPTKKKAKQSQNISASGRTMLLPATHVVKKSSDTLDWSSGDAQISLGISAKGKRDIYFDCVPLQVSVGDLLVNVKDALGIPYGQPAYLSLNNQELNPRHLIMDTGIKDQDHLALLEMPPRTHLHLPPSPALPRAGLYNNNIGTHEPPLDLRNRLVSHRAAQPVPGPIPDSHPQAAPQPAPPPPPVKTEPPLCKEQQEVVDLIIRGRNVFYTGSAGCGKSTVLKSFVSKLRDKGKVVNIVAPTGKAALDINGSTTWTYAGWTPGHMKRPLHELVKAAHGKFVSQRLRKTNVLVIDEISMVENHLLTRLSAIMKAARGNDRPFGGVQLVVTGDFCQLPPVRPFQHCITCGRETAQRTGPNGVILYRCRDHGDYNDDDKWAFRSTVWEECKFVHVNLTNIHRQSDRVFIEILQKLRIGKPLSPADRALLIDHPCDVKNAAKLFSTREEVRRVNQTEFDRLRTAKRDYTCLDYFSWNEQHGNLRNKGLRSPHDNSLEALREHKLDRLVEFKAGMLVVLLINLDITNGLVNGSQGRVIGFEPYAVSKLPKAALRDGDRFFPEVPTKAKSKFRLPGEDTSDAAPAGELRGEYAPLREAQIQDFLLQAKNLHKMWPVVEFDNGVRRTIYADCQIHELGEEKPYTLLARTQIPLVAAWAMTVHKSQGMTLNRVIVDLGRSFEQGQEYVALSRARSLQGLKVVSLGVEAGAGGNLQVKRFLREKFGIQ